LKVAFLTGSTHGIPRLGGEARIYHLAKSLAAIGVDVDLFGSTFQTELIGRGMSQSHAVNKWSGGDWYPISVASSPTLVRSIPSLIRKAMIWGDYDVIISELGSSWQALCTKEIVRLPMILDEHNVEWQLMRQQEVTTGIPLPWERLRIFEKLCHKAFDQVIVVSALDKSVFEIEGTSSQKMTVVPNGVDTEAFREEKGLRLISRSKLGLDDKIPLIMYMGSMKFFPNVDAMGSLLTRIYPRAKALVPNVRLMITGPGTEALAGPSTQGMIITGVVYRGELPSYINAADICLAPIRFGSGTRFKILEWMACGRAIIATEKAAEGIEVTSDDNIILENNFDKYPALISDLSRDDQYRARLGRSARKLVESKYSWDKCITPLGELLRRL